MTFQAKLLATTTIGLLALSSLAEAGPAAKRKRGGDAAGAVYGMTPSECGTYGGTPAKDGNGMEICSFGPPVASFNCGNAGTVAVLGNRFGETFLSRGGSLEKVRQMPSGSGAMWAGNTSTLHSKGSEAVLDGPGGRTSCAAPARERGKADAPGRADGSQEPGVHRN